MFQLLTLEVVDQNGVRFICQDTSFEMCSGRNHGGNAHSFDQSRIILKDHPCNIHVHHKESFFSKGGRIAWNHSYSDNHCVVLRVQPAAGIVIDGHHYPSMYKQLGHAQALMVAGG